MPWQEITIVSSRKEFVMLASKEGANISELCSRFGISRTTGYKWLKRSDRDDAASLENRSRRPKSSPGQTSGDLEAAVIAVRREHPRWGGRKIRAVLLRRNIENAPAASTITGILARHGMIDPAESAARKPFIRFEHEAPNRLWQIDFKGHFALSETTARCHPLTVVDDHSRFALEIGACANEQTATVRERLSGAFRRYGLPERMTMDNGAPWGSSGETDHGLTPLTVWLIRLGIKISHSRPFHPQTQGKNERFNGTLKMEILRDHSWRDLVQAQNGFDRWRDIYNLERPHEAIGMKVPADRYCASQRTFPETLPTIEYPAGSTVRQVRPRGFVKYKGRLLRVPRALHGHPVAIENTATDGLYDIKLLHQKITQLDLREKVP